MLVSLRALAEEMYEIDQQRTFEQNSLQNRSLNIVLTNRVKYLEGLEKAKVLVLAMKEPKWYKFHDSIARTNIE